VDAFGDHPEGCPGLCVDSRARPSGGIPPPEDGRPRTSAPRAIRAAKALTATSVLSESEKPAALRQAVRSTLDGSIDLGSAHSRRDPLLIRTAKETMPLLD